MKRDGISSGAQGEGAGLQPPPAGGAGMALPGGRRPGAVVPPSCCLPAGSQPPPAPVGAVAVITVPDAACAHHAMGQHRPTLKVAP